MKSRRFEDYGNTVQRLYCRDLPEMKSVCRNVTLQITNSQCKNLCLVCKLSADSYFPFVNMAQRENHKNINLL